MSGLIWSALLVSTPYSPVRFLQESVWSTRGWTYQEAFFSRRQLVFTEQQAYLECNCMSCDEARKSHVELFGLQRTGESSAAFPTRAQESPEDISLHICRYNDRILTEPSDILRGILSTLRSFERRYGITHFWGIPSMIPLQIETSAAREEVIFVDGLCWNHRGQKFSRRIGFLSWSWAGWIVDQNTLYWDHLIIDSNCDYFSTSEDIYLSIELDDGRNLPWVEAAQAHSHLPTAKDGLLPIVHLAGLTANIEIIEGFDDYQEGGEQVKYLLENGSYGTLEEPTSLGLWMKKSYLRLTRGGLDLPLSCTGILMGKCGFSRNLLLLVSEVSPDAKERIGIISDLRDEYLERLQLTRRDLPGGMA